MRKMGRTATVVVVVVVGVVVVVSVGRMQSEGRV